MCFLLICSHCYSLFRLHCEITLHIPYNITVLNTPLWYLMGQPIDNPSITGFISMPGVGDYVECALQEHRSIVTNLLESINTASLYVSHAYQCLIFQLHLHLRLTKTSFDDNKHSVTLCSRTSASVTGIRSSTRNRGQNSYALTLQSNYISFHWSYIIMSSTLFYI